MKTWPWIVLNTIKDAERVYWTISYRYRSKSRKNRDGYFDTYWEWQLKEELTSGESGQILTGHVDTQYDSKPSMADILQAAVHKQVALLLCM